ncbi:TPA: hypothetical protein HA338_06535 [Methanosarcina acetivorans]|nr:hypothetical protein [Methanosarcina acetivorans]HIH93698.1 hypothetical protein [Methanosarcina acetivorans]
MPGKTAEHLSINPAVAGSGSMTLKDQEDHGKNHMQEVISAPSASALTEEKMVSVYGIEARVTIDENRIQKVIPSLQGQAI